MLTVALIAKVHRRAPRWIVPSAGTRVDLPPAATMAALSRGELDLPRARALLQATDVLDPTDARITAFADLQCPPLPDEIERDPGPETDHLAA